MAKQHRAKTSSAVPKATPLAASLKPRPAAEALSATSKPQPAVRPGYVEAVALYEQGMAALQSHDYSRASSLLRSVLSRYPEEKELHERVRLYLNVCERQIVPRAQAPITPEERVFAATVAFNAGNYDDALKHLREAVREAPEHDYALYMLASVLTTRGETDEAVTHLLHAIELNEENRSMARHDADLEPLREVESVRVALETAPSVKAERRRPSRRSR
jgi:tetratricopeptide (TPR) repeat protein